MDEQSKGSAPVGGRRGRRRGLWLMVSLVLVLAAVWFAPAMVANSPLRQQIIPRLAPEFAGQTAVGSASLGWLSPVVLSDVSARDASGEPLLEAASIRSEKSLLALIRDQQHLGTFLIARPRLHLLLRNDGSNLEDAMAPLLNTPADSASKQCTVEITDGSIEVREQGNTRTWNVQQMVGSLNLSDDEAKPLTAKLAGVVDAANGKSGRAEAELRWGSSSGGESTSTPDAAKAGGLFVHVTSESLPLTTLKAVLRRFVGDLHMEGELTTKFDYNWQTGASGPTLNIQQLEAQNFALLAPQWIGVDELRLAALKSHGQIALLGERLELQELDVESDIAKLQATGGVPWTALTGGQFTSAMTAALQSEDYQIDGEIDLARLARVLPATLHVREGTEITAGSVTLSMTSRVEGDRRRWSGKLSTRDLAAKNGTQVISWDKPVLLNLSAVQSPGGPIIESLSCDSSFLQLTGKGTLADGNVTAQGNLTQLAAELDQFVDLGELKLAGELQGDLRWQRGAADRIDASGDVAVRNFELTIPGARPWREQELNVSLTAAGAANQAGIQRIDSAWVQVLSGNDQFEAQLVKPVAQPSLSTAWPVECRLIGALPTWQARLQSFVPLAGWDLDGNVDLKFEGTLARERIDVAKANVQVEQLRAWGHGLYISEPMVRTETTGSWDQVRKELTSKLTTLTSSTVALRADDVSLQLTESDPRVAGKFDYRADLARLMSWTANPSDVPSQQLRGSVTGSANMTHDAGVTSGRLSADIQNLELARRLTNSAGATNVNAWQTIWQENRLTLAGQGGYQHSRESLTLTNLDVTSDALRVVSQGQIDKPLGDCRVDLQGEIQYDLQGAVEKLRPYLGPNVQFAGRDARKFTLRGSLPSFEPEPAPPVGTPVTISISSTSSSTSPAPGPWPADLTGQGSVGWTSARVHGLTVGNGEIQGQLSNAVVNFSPLDLPVSEGRLKLAPRLMLNETPMLLVLDKGPLIEQMRISPEMCQTWLKYVAPLLADVTQAEGKFSVNLSGAAIPLASPETGTAQGVLTIHAAQVGPGPLSKEFLWIAKQVKAIIEKRPFDPTLPGNSSEWLTMPQQNIEFQMRDGRVAHRGLELHSKDVVIRTQGSVGVDQTLSLVAEVPIRDEWVTRDRLLSGLQGQALQIPIQGTLSQPKVDGRVLEQLTKQMIGGAANRLLEQELNKGLERLFRPKN